MSRRPTMGCANRVLFPLGVSVGTESERQIDPYPTNRLRHAPAGGVPRGRGVRGAARGLERELKGTGATQKEE